MNITSISNIIFQEKYNVDFTESPLTDNFCNDKILGYIKKGVQKYYLFKCDTCASDPELHGHGIYLMKKYYYDKGKIPCGCSSRVIWTQYQYKVRLKRLGTQDYEFIDFHSFDQFNSIGIFKCSTHGTVLNPIESFLKGCKCKKCHIEKIKINDDVHIDDFMNSGSFHNGTIFGRSETLNHKGNADSWIYKCPICSADEYVKLGLCSGLFENSTNHMKNGILSCRCSSKYVRTQEQREYQIKKHLHENSKDTTFIEWKDTYVNQYSKCVMSCNEHGNFISTPELIIFKNQGCPVCGFQNQKQCYINAIKENNNIIALKYGISSNYEYRVRRQNRNSIYNIENINVWIFDNTNDCKMAENECKQIFGNGVILKENMPDGYTETTLYKNLSTIISVYEKYGGILLDFK